LDARGEVIGEVIGLLTGEQASAGSDRTGMRVFSSAEADMGRTREGDKTSGTKAAGSEGLTGAGFLAGVHVGFEPALAGGTGLECAPTACAAWGSSARAAARACSGDSKTD
jgi:hypothetical protein